MHGLSDLVKYSDYTWKPSQTPSFVQRQEHSGYQIYLNICLCCSLFRVEQFADDAR